MFESPVVLTWSLQATPLFLLAGLAALGLRGRSAAHRHFIWMLAVVGALVLPVLGLVAPPVSVPLLPALEEARGGSSALQVVSVPLANPSPAQVPAGSDQQVLPTTPASWLPALEPSPLAILWAVGAVLLGGFLLVSLAGLARGVEAGTAMTEGSLAAELDAARRALRIRRPVRLVISRTMSMPMTFGIMRPVVLLPVEARDWPQDRRRAVMLHELAHVRRADWLTLLAARVACVLYWWNPLVWLAARRLRVERELACDDLVLANGARAADYAHDLLEIARAMRRPTVSALAGVPMARPSHLAGRLLAVLDRSRSRRPMSRQLAIAAATLAGLLVVPAAGLRAVHKVPLALVAQDERVGDVGLPRKASPRAGVTDRPTVRPSDRLSIRPSDRLTVRPSKLLEIPPSQQRPGTLCDWSREGERHTSNTSIDDHRATIRILVDECELLVRTRGRVDFSDDDRTITGLESDGFFEIEERRDGERRRVEVNRDGGALERRWIVNGREQPWQAAAEDWLHGILLAMFRRTSFGAEDRARRIYGARGKAGLLAETAQLRSSSALTTYYSLLLEREKLTSAEARQVAEEAGERISSSSGLATVLTGLLRNAGPDEATRAAIIRSANRISSSSSQGQVLVAAAETGPLTPALADAILETVTKISSSSEKGRVLVTVGERLPADRPLPASYVSAASEISSGSEKGRVLAHLIERDRLAPERALAVLDVAQTISSSSELGRILRLLVARQPLSDQTRAEFFRTAGQISSSSEQENVLLAVVRSGPDPATVAGVIDASTAISSSSSQANVLVAVARGGLVTSDALRQAYRDAAQGIGSSSERARALAAVQEGRD